MTAQNKTVIKSYFETDDEPDESQFINLIDSYADVDTTIPISGWIPAGVTWTYASADDPSFTFTVASNVTGTYTNGTRIKLIQTTDKYFIVTKTSFSAPNTTVTIYGGTDYDLANAAITTPLYSPVKAPQGFPLDPNKWAVDVSDTTLRTQSSPVNGTWYNLGSLSINIPIGIWVVDYQLAIELNRAAGGTCDQYTTLSKANNSEDDVEFTSLSFTNSLIRMIEMHQRNKVLDLSVKDTYYLNSKTGNASQDDINLRNDLVTFVLRAVSSYL